MIEPAVTMFLLIVSSQVLINFPCSFSYRPTCFSDFVEEKLCREEGHIKETLSAQTTVSISC